MTQPVWTGDLPLPVDWYLLPDGRRFYGMASADLVEFCRKGWERQAVLDRQLARLLDEQRQPGPVSGIGPVASSVPKYQHDLFVA
jgi:hypothetical protein